MSFLPSDDDVRRHHGLPYGSPVRRVLQRVSRLAQVAFRPDPSPRPLPPRPFPEALADVEALPCLPLVDEYDTLVPPDYAVPSMFYGRDALIELSRGPVTDPRWAPHRTQEESALALAVERLVVTEDLGHREVRLDWLSGLSNAKDRDCGTLQAFGDQMLPRAEWPPGVQWYGFDTERDWERTWGSANARDLAMNGVLGTHRDPVVTYRTWDGRWFFHNGPAAHRLAAASRQDREQGRGTTFEAHVLRVSVDPEAAATTLRLAVGLFLEAGTWLAVTGLLERAGYRPLLPVQAGPGIRVLWLPLADERTHDVREALVRASRRTHVYDVTAAVRRAVSA